MLKRPVVIVWVIIWAVASASCSYEKFVPDDVEAFVDESETLLVDGDTDGLRALMTEELAANATDDQIAAIVALLPAGETPDEATWLGYRAYAWATTSGSSSATDVVRQLTFGEQRFIVQQRLVRTDEGLRQLALTVTPVTDEIAAAMSFSLTGKSPAHYAVFALLIALPLFTLATIVAVWRTRRLKRPILWTLFVLFGFGTLTFNWATGAFGTTLIQATADRVMFNFLQAQLFSVSASQAVLSPLIFTLSFPLGACLFWLQKSRRSLRLKEPKTSDQEPSAAPPDRR